MVLWLGLHVPGARGLGLIPGQGTRSHMLQLRLRMPQERFHVCVLSCFSCVQFFATPWTLAHQLPYPWNSPGKNTGVGCHALPPEDLPNPGIEPGSPALQADSLLSEPPGKAMKGIRGPEMDGARASILDSPISLSSGAHAHRGLRAEPCPPTLGFFSFFFLAISHGMQDLSSPSRN